jgi:hypothetical protein
MANLGWNGVVPDIDRAIETMTFNWDNAQLEAYICNHPRDYHRGFALPFQVVFPLAVLRNALGYGAAPMFYRVNLVWVASKLYYYGHQRNVHQVLYEGGFDHGGPRVLLMRVNLAHRVWTAEEHALGNPPAV